MADAGMGSISAVVGTLPAEFNLGEAREFNRIDYVLCYNSSTNAEISAGKIASPVLAGAGVYSVTVSNASKTNAHIGAVCVQNTTVPTGYYFWGAKIGYVAGLVGDTASLPTGSALYLSGDGEVTLFPQSAVTGNIAVGVVVTTVSNGGARSGSAYISLL